MSANFDPSSSMSDLAVARARDATVWPAYELPRSLPDLVRIGQPFSFYQWGHRDTPAGDKVDVYSMELNDHTRSPDTGDVLEASFTITNIDTRSSVDLRLVSDPNGGFIAGTEGGLTHIDEIPAYLDRQIDLPHRSVNPATLLNRFRDRIAERAKSSIDIDEDAEYKTSFDV